MPKAYIAAVNSGNFDAALAFYTDNAVVKNPLELFVGKQQIGDWLKADARTTCSRPAGYQVNGNTMVVTGTVSLDRFMKIGVDPVAFRAEYLVGEGKIRSFSPTVLLTPEQQAKVAAVAAATKTQKPIVRIEVAPTANPGEPAGASMIWPGRLARSLSARSSLSVGYLLPSDDHEIARAARGKAFVG